MESTGQCVSGAFTPFTLNRLAAFYSVNGVARKLLFVSVFVAALAHAPALYAASEDFLEFMQTVEHPFEHPYWGQHFTGHFAGPQPLTEAIFDQRSEVGAGSRIDVHVSRSAPYTLTSSRERYDYFCIRPRARGAVLPTMAGEVSVSSLVVVGFAMDVRMRAFLESWKSVRSLTILSVPSRSFDESAWRGFGFPYEELDCRVAEFVALTGESLYPTVLKRLRLTTSREGQDAERIAAMLPRFESLEQVDLHFALSNAFLRAFAGLPNLASVGIFLPDELTLDIELWRRSAPRLTSFRTLGWWGAYPHLRAAKGGYRDILAEPLAESAADYVRGVLRLVAECTALRVLYCCVPIFDVGDLPETTIAGIRRLLVPVLTPAGLARVSAARSVTHLHVQPRLELLKTDGEISVALGQLRSLRFLHIDFNEHYNTPDDSYEICKRDLTYLLTQVEVLVLRSAIVSLKGMSDLSVLKLEGSRLRYLDAGSRWSGLEPALVRVVTHAPLEGMALTWSGNTVPWKVLDAVTHRERDRPLAWVALRCAVPPVPGAAIVDGERLLEFIATSGVERVALLGFRVSESADECVAFVKQVYDLESLRHIAVDALASIDELSVVVGDRINAKISHVTPVHFP